MAKQYNNRDILAILRWIDKGNRPSAAESRALSGRRRLLLHDTVITAIPESISLLTKLQSLNLSWSSITAMPESVWQLAQLQSLDLSYTQITALPESFGQLAQLQSLNLNHTHITALPESLGRLAQLQSLDLSDTRITALPESLGQLTQLQHLDLRNTKITALPESFGQLANLQSLELEDTKITAMPESVWQLAQLQSLNLNHTRITALPESVGRLAQLQHLDLRGTPITTLPESFGQLAKLQSLDLRYTQLNALPESFGRLAQLQHLDLRDTPITTLPESFGQLAQLQHLNLSYTQITALPEALALGPLPIRDKLPSDSDSGIFAYQSALPSYYFQDKEILAEYFGKGKKQGFREAKIFFLGDGNAGKTFTVRRFLAEGAPEKPEAPYSPGQTHGVCPYDYPHQKDGKDFLVHIWDFGGQELLHAMHRCFLTEDTVYVLMVSTRDAEHTRRLRYWLQSVRPYARGAEILIIVNVFDGEGQADIDEIGLQNEFKQDLRLRFETLSVKDCAQDEFRARIMEPLLRKAEAAEAAAGLHPAAFMKVRDRVKQALAKSRDEAGGERGWIDAAKYLECCRAENIDEAPRQAALLRYFTNLGVCFSTVGPAEKEVPADCRLFRPIWLTNALYAVIEECEPVKGWLTQRMIEACLGGEPGKGHSEKYVRVAPALRYNPTDCGYVLRVAEASALAYRDPEAPEDIFLPATCSYADKRPEELRMPERPAFHLIYELECPYLPETAVQRLMLEFLREGFRRPVCWRGGFRFENKDCNGILDTVEDDRVLRLKLWSKKETPVYQQLEWFRARLVQALARWEGVKEYISTGEERYLLQRLLNAKHNHIGQVASALRQDLVYEVSALLGSIPDESPREGPKQPGNTYVNNFFGNGNAVNEGSGGSASVYNQAAEQRTELRWERFAANFPDTDRVFEFLCMELFALEYFERGAVFPAVPNNPGLECHPQLARKGGCAGKRVGFQAKYYRGAIGYADVRDSVKKAIDYYHTGRAPAEQLECFVLYCSQKPSEGDGSGKLKGNQTFAETKALLRRAGIDLIVYGGQDLLNRVREYPELVKRYFYA